jgi:hypothetical protein
MIYSLKTKREVHPRYATLNEDERGNDLSGGGSVKNETKAYLNSKTITIGPK